LRYVLATISAVYLSHFPLVQTGPGAHPASCKMSTGSPPGVEARRPRREAEPPPDLVCRVPRKSRAVSLLTLRVFVAYRKGENLPTCVYLRRKGLVRYSDDALLGASVAHAPKKIPSIVVRFSLNLHHRSSY